MFRLSNLLDSVVSNKPSRSLDGAIAIWNFTNRCNLSCLHCYSRADLDSVDVLDLETIKQTIIGLKQSGIKFIIFSGGEPLARKDIFEIADFCRQNGIITYLSTNGLYINNSNVQKIIDTFNYIGISIDGDEETHDYFRGLKGSFTKSMTAVRLIKSLGGRVGIRFTMTKATIESLPSIFKLCEDEKIDKLYLSHLVYSGRGLENLAMDLDKQTRRTTVEYILDKAFEYYQNNIPIEIVTGNMEQDAIMFLTKFGEVYPELKETMHKRLRSWGGNSAGVKLVNIDSRGFVKPDPFFPKTLGNIMQTEFSSIWQNVDDYILVRLRANQRILGGRCGICKYLDVCNGGSRARAYCISGNLWDEDPSCYLNDKEIGL